MIDQLEADLKRHEGEEWRVIAGFEDYAVSSFGRIRSLTPRKGARAEKCGGIIKGFIRSPRKGKQSAIAVSLRRDKKTYTFRVHRLVLEAFIGPCPYGMECCHNDGNFRNNALQNLRWDTHKSNVKDAKEHGTFVNPPIHLGEDHHNTKLTEADIRQIRSIEIKRGSLTALARKYGVASITIRRILDREVWGHIQDAA